MRIDLALQAGLAVKNAGPELTKLKKASQQVEGIFVRDLLAAGMVAGGTHIVANTQVAGIEQPDTSPVPRLNDPDQP